MIHDTHNALISTQYDPDSHQAVAQLSFREDLELFKGHFPRDPIVPGVHQIEIVRMTVEKSLNARLRIRQIKSAKFTRKVLPSENLDVLITRLEDSGSIVVKATIKVGEEVASKFSLVLERDVSDTEDILHDE